MWTALAQKEKVLEGRFPVVWWIRTAKVRRVCDTRDQA